MLKSGLECILIEARQDLGAGLAAMNFCTHCLCVVITVSLKILVMFKLIPMSPICQQNEAYVYKTHEFIMMLKSKTNKNMLTGFLWMLLGHQIII